MKKTTIEMPTELTPEMIVAALDAVRKVSGATEQMRVAYKTMQREWKKQRRA